MRFGDERSRVHRYAPSCVKAGEGTRTLDIQLGKLALYQLSYTRGVRILLLSRAPSQDPAFLASTGPFRRRGSSAIRSVGPVRRRELGLEVHAWKLMGDQASPDGLSAEDETRRMYDLGVDAVFADDPAQAVRIRDERN